MMLQVLMAGWHSTMREWKKITKKPGKARKSYSRTVRQDEPLTLSSSKILGWAWMGFGWNIFTPHGQPWEILLGSRMMFLCVSVTSFSRLRLYPENTPPLWSRISEIFMATGQDFSNNNLRPCLWLLKVMPMTQHNFSKKKIVNICMITG